MSRYRLLLPGLAVLCVVAACTPAARSCSRVLWNDNGHSVLVGRNMDWLEDMHRNIWVLPRGMQRSGLAEVNPLIWTSRYGSVVITGHDLATVDGVNERGLAVHMLYLPETSVSPRDEKIPGLSMTLWLQYYLDNFASVSEAVVALKTQPYQLLMAEDPHSRKPLTIHISLDDSTGDSAIVECLNGPIRVFHDRNYTVMTNQPTFDLQLENLKQYRGFGGERRLPGSHEPADRFVRAAFYVKHLPQPQSQREAVAALMSVMRNVSAPFGVADPERPNVSTTIWRTVTDLTNGVLYFDGVFSPQVFWLHVNQLNFDADQPVRKLTVDGNFSLMGEVSGELRPEKMFEFHGPIPSE